MYKNYNLKLRPSLKPIGSDIVFPISNWKHNVMHHCTSIIHYHRWAVLKNLGLILPWRNRINAVYAIAVSEYITTPERRTGQYEHNIQLFLRNEGKCPIFSRHLRQKQQTAADEN